MKRLIYAPAIFEKNKKLSDRINHFFLGLEKTCKFETIYSDHLDPRAKDAAIVLIYAGAHGHNLLKESISLKQPKKIYLLTGPHALNRSIVSRIIEVSDLTLITYQHYFKKKFPQFIEKTRFFPLYFAPHERYSKLKTRKRPIMKCLLTGHVNPNLYPLRAALRSRLESDDKLRDRLILMRHPRWTRGGPLKSYEIGPFLNQTYAEAINKYFAALATDSVYNYGLAKYYEIPAAGALLLARPTPDIKSVGFKAWAHYVPIEKNNVLDRIFSIFESPANFKFIRDSGREFVLDNHSVRNRIREFKKLLEMI